jgi:hypothetical protein
MGDFSVVLFRPNFMLASEEHLMKMHKNQWVSNLLSPPAIPCGATNQGTPMVPEVQTPSQ